MTLPNKQALKSRIIDLFCKHPALTAREIHGCLPDFTLQAVYKELNALADETILIKIGKSWAPHISWILQLQAYAAKLASTSFNATQVMSALTEHGKQRWHFQNLFEMNDFWASIFTYLVRKERVRHTLAWNPYQWFYLFQGEEESRFHRSLQLIGSRMVVISAPDCFLNIWARKFLEEHNIQYSMSPGPYQNEMDTYYNIVGHYVITVKLARDTARKLNTIFQNAKSFEELALGDLSNLFMKEGHATFTIERNSAKAARMRKQFENYFGEDFSS